MWVSVTIRSADGHPGNPRDGWRWRSAPRVRLTRAVSGGNGCVNSRGKWARDNCNGVTIVVRGSRAEEDSVKLKNDGTSHLETQGVFSVVKHGWKVNFKPERKPAFRSVFTRAAAGRSTWSRGRACVHVLCSPLSYCVKCTTGWLDCLALFG